MIWVPKCFWIIFITWSLLLLRAIFRSHVEFLGLSLLCTLEIKLSLIAGPDKERKISLWPIGLLKKSNIRFLWYHIDGPNNSCAWCRWRRLLIAVVVPLWGAHSLRTSPYSKQVAVPIISPAGFGGRYRFGGCISLDRLLYSILNSKNSFLSNLVHIFYDNYCAKCKLPASGNIIRCSYWDISEECILHNPLWLNYRPIWHVNLKYWCFLLLFVVANHRGLFSIASSQETYWQLLSVIPDFTEKLVVLYLFISAEVCMWQIFFLFLFSYT